MRLLSGLGVIVSRHERTIGGADSDKSCGILSYGRVRVIIIDKMLAGKYGCKVV